MFPQVTGVFLFGVPEYLKITAFWFAFSEKIRMGRVCYRHPLKNPAGQRQLFEICQREVVVRVEFAVNNNYQKRKKQYFFGKIVFCFFNHHLLASVFFGKL